MQAFLIMYFTNFFIQPVLLKVKKLWANGLVKFGIDANAACQGTEILISLLVVPFLLT